ncbi:MAG: LysE family translocator [Actinomycetota bacterium]|nr:LysE family translocator [Actinomycetota bacterium]
MSQQAAAFAAFAVVAALLTMTPGVDSMLVLRTAAVAGGRTAMLAGFGVITGLLCWGLAAGVGLAAVLAASETAYTVLRLAGAAYLGWLGVRRLIRASRGPQPATDGVPAATVGRGRAYSQGLVTNLLNPKIGVFYVTLLPQFVIAGQPVLLVTFGLALVHAAEGVLWFVAVSWLAGRIGALLRRRRARRVLDATTGTVFLGFAARLALDGGR